MDRPSAKMPPGARKFIRSSEGRASAAIARSFHRWLARKDIDLRLVDAAPADLWWFIHVVGPSGREQYAAPLDSARRLRELLPYLDWLRRQELLHFDPALLAAAPPPPACGGDPYSAFTSAPHFLWLAQHSTVPRARRARRDGRVLRPRRPLAPEAERFASSLRPTHKTSTVCGYENTLRRFHAFLDERGGSLDKLTRRDVDLWRQRLHALGLHPSTRLSMLLHVRAYFRWARDDGLLMADPDDLVRRSDFPKLPQYLPRPLPPDVDAALQARLAGGDTYALALLLMRRTGLRIGELLHLEHQCLRPDTKGRPFLKVPLGKLDNERLVPLDEVTLDLLRRLQATGTQPRQLLLGNTNRQVPRREPFYQALAEASRGLVVTEPIISHRLRHSFATTLLGAGMSLPALMRILGHRDHRMTLRYAAITDELVLKEYTEALAKLGERYAPRIPQPSADKDPLTLLDDVARWVKSRVPKSADAAALVKRIRRVAAAVRDVHASRRP
jgi:site-specific recombinase XerD